MLFSLFHPLFLHSSTPDNPRISIVMTGANSLLSTLRKPTTLRRSYSSPKAIGEHFSDNPVVIHD
ncbi:MAG TPA: hypothetical protein VK892_03875 [Pyrinomonadaceae bacterium]|nr:hypothetical protein [Pyrinomonadaceae bacterium]